MVPEAPVETADGALAPVGDGWFVLNARDARWLGGHFGCYTAFEGDSRFPALGINIGVVRPGQPACLYHGEDQQEDFLVLCGEALLLIEGQERLLKRWDLVHCPPWTEHVIIGAGKGTCAILGVGARPSEGVLYPASELAQRHHAGVIQETRDPAEAYASTCRDRPIGFDPDWL
jgi:uncharacterized cupin superfamily protein